MRLLFILLSSLLFAHAATAEEAPIVQAQLIADAPTVQADSPITIGLRLDITQDWHVYWENPGDSGMPTQIRWNDVPEGVTISDIAWPTPERLPYGTLVNYGYSNRVTFPITVTANADMPNLTLNAKATWLVCKDICIPESADLTITLPHTNADARITLDTALDHIPEAEVAGDYRASEDVATIAIPLENGISYGAADIASAHWFPLDDGIVQNSAPQQFVIENEQIQITVPRGTAATKAPYRGVIALHDTDGEPIDSYYVALALETAATTDAIAPEPHIPTPEPAAPTTPVDGGTPTSLIEALLLALFGGLVLNLMPCVLPVLSLKALALAKKAEASRSAALAQGISYTAGVVLSFLAIAGVLIALTQAGNAIGWGFQLQSPGVIAGLAMLMVLVALNLFGMFEWPTIFGGVSGPNNQDSPAGSFFTGMLAVAVATPCTAPFMAPALGYAALQPPIGALAIFAALGLGLSAPFLLISAWPAARRILPKPGMWMITFKQALAFPMLATAMWLLWVQVQLNQAMGLAVTFTGILLLGLCLWLRQKAPKSAWLWLLVALATIIGTIMYQPPVQTMAPSAHHASINQTAYSADALQSLREQGIPVFIDATAAWCITCKINEQTSLRDSDVEATFAEKGVTLMIADWTAQDEAITKYLAKYGRNGVPLYVYYAPGKQGVVLPQILTPSIVIDALTNS